MDNHTSAVRCATCAPGQPLFFKTTSGRVLLVMQVMVAFYLLVGVLMWFNGNNGWHAVWLAAWFEGATTVICFAHYRATLWVAGRR